MRLIGNHYTITIFLLLLCSCGKSDYLYTNLEYCSADDLASAHVFTPDSYCESEQDVEILFIKWKVSFRDAPLKLRLTLIRENLQQEEKTAEGLSNKGTISFSISAKEEKRRGGVLAYKTQLFNKDGALLHENTHKMWTKINPKVIPILDCKFRM